MALLRTCLKCRQFFITFHRTKTSYSLLKSKVMLRESVKEARQIKAAIMKGDSLLAQRLAKQQGKVVMQRVNTSSPDSDISALKSRLENLLIEWDGTSKLHGSPIGQDGEVPVSNKAEDTYEAVESITLPSDLSQQNESPSPILGTEDPSVPASNIPCVGCGAPLQCQHKTFPGFLPSECYKALSEKELKKTICQRCYFMRHCDAFMEVTKEPDEYKKLIAEIKPTQSAVVLVVDVTDMHGSIINDLKDYIGETHPLIVVGNKADLLSPDGPDYLRHVSDQLKSTCRAAGLSRIHKVSLVSAKTGFGLEKFINILFGLYRKRVDVYIVGSANAGKSSLFNALLASDYCKSSARNLIDRATVSVWPGTTLNMLKFPIMRPSTRVVALRHRRLKQALAQWKLQNQIEKERARAQRAEKATSPWELREEVHTTDVGSRVAREHEEKGSAWGQKIAGYQSQPDGTLALESSTPLVDLSEYDEDKYSGGYWAYDTPGVINPDQVLHLLTPDELAKLTPASMITPRSLSLRVGETLFISGLGRLDFIEGDGSMQMAVHAGPAVPIHVVPTDEADAFYETYCGKKVLGVPIGEKERLDKLPSLVAKEFEVFGEDGRIAVADIQFSSIGWVSLAPQRNHTAVVLAFTPGRKGLYLRTPALLPQHFVYRGKRIGGTAFYRTKPSGWIMSKQKIPKKYF